jgi:hypothetical protein
MNNEERKALAKSLDNMIEWFFADNTFFENRTEEEMYFEAVMALSSITTIQILLEKGWLPEWPKQEVLNDLNEEIYAKTYPHIKRVLSRIYPDAANETQDLFYQRDSDDEDGKPN